MANTITEKDVREMLESLEKEGYDLSRYSRSALVFAYLLGLYPEECTGMYPEDAETARLFDKVYGIMTKIFKKKA